MQHGPGFSDMLKRKTELEAFVAAYDAWRVAEDAVESKPDGTPYETLLPLCKAAAAAEAALIKCREDLRNR